MTSPFNLDVSRETYERLQTYADVLKRWNHKINLVSKSTLENLWRRHMLDSIEVFRCANITKGKWVDLGSGGGFPGLVVAICAAETAPDLSVTLVESDQRKAAFLRTAAREAGVGVTVLSKRIEAIEPLDADVISARALSELSKLLDYCARHLTPTGIALFPKGVTWEKELQDARQSWQFEHEVVHSATEPGSVILKVKGVARG